MFSPGTQLNCPPPVHQLKLLLATSASGTFRTSLKLQAFDSLNQFRSLILHVTHRA